MQRLRLMLSLGLLSRDRNDASRGEGQNAPQPPLHDIILPSTRAPHSLLRAHAAFLLSHPHRTRSSLFVLKASARCLASTSSARTSRCISSTCRTDDLFPHAHTHDSKSVTSLCTNHGRLLPWHNVLPGARAFVTVSKGHSLKCNYALS